MKIAILGAGVAGMASAIALKQQGYDVSLYERRPAPTHIGAGIVIWPNASFVLNELGLLADVAEYAGMPQKMRRMSCDHQDLGYIDIATLNQQMGFPSYSILRRDLQQALLNKLDALGVTIEYGKAAASIACDTGDNASVTFADNTKTGADIIIGADGRMNSIARAYVNGDNSPIYQGFVNWIAVLDTSEEIVQEMSIVDIWGIGERFGIVPIAKNKIYWAGAKAQTSMTSATPLPHKDELTAIFADWPAPVPMIIECTAETSIGKIVVHDHEPINNWHKDNVLLMGDAAHAALPTSGQGACQALEDAWHFMNCLASHPESIQDAFEAFTALRLSKTSAITQAARGFAQSLFNNDPAYCRERNRKAKVSDPVLSASNMANLWGQGLPIGT